MGFSPSDRVKTPFSGPPNASRAKKPKKHVDFWGSTLYIGFAIPYDLKANNLAQFCF
jgi:hypothetical protein